MSNPALLYQKWALADLTSTAQLKEIHDDKLCSCMAKNAPQVLV